MEQQILQRLRCAILCLLLLGMAFPACSGQKNTAGTAGTELKNLRCFTQKVYPGVSGEVVYFVQYRIEFDLRTNSAVDFKYLEAGGREIPIQSVKHGNKLINTHLGSLLDSDADNVELNATLPMRQSELGQTQTGDLVNPKHVVLTYVANDEQHAVTIDTIQNEPDQFRPAAPPGRD